MMAQHGRRERKHAEANKLSMGQNCCISPQKCMGQTAADEFIAIAVTGVDKAGAESTYLAARAHKGCAHTPAFRVQQASPKSRTVPPKRSAFSDDGEPLNGGAIATCIKLTSEPPMRSRKYRATRLPMLWPMMIACKQDA